MDVSVLRHRAAGAGEEAQEDQGHTTHNGTADVVSAHLTQALSTVML